MKSKLWLVLLVVSLIFNGGMAAAASDPGQKAAVSSSQPTQPAQPEQVQPAAGHPAAPSAPLASTGTAFTYQGRLKNAGSPVNGPHDLQFRLYDALNAGSQLGSTQTVLSQTVTDGLFTVVLDFGQIAAQGDARWLEISVRATGAGSYTALLPRQALTAAPYALSLIPGAIISGNGSSTMLSTYNYGNGQGIYGYSANGTGVNATGGSYGVYGSSGNGTGVFGSSSWIGTYGGGGVWGVYGNGNNNGSIGVYGTSSGVSSVGVKGVVSGTNAAVYGDNNGTGYGVRGESETGVAVYGSTSNGDTSSGAVTGSNSNSTGTGVYGSGSGYGVQGVSGTGIGVRGTTSGIQAGVSGSSSGTNGKGVSGTANIGTAARGVDGFSGLGYGVYGQSGGGGTVAGVYGISNGFNGIGVWGVSTNGIGSAGVYGASNVGYGGYFDGDVHVNGFLSKGGGSFKIDHPLDPENKYLYHSFVESPDMMNVYNGNITTDAKGEAIVTMPDWFETLNRDFRYQLTILGDQFAQARVSKEIENNRFTIKTDQPNVKVSWQVTGIRHDPLAEQHRIQVEVDKPDYEKGKYMHPETYGQPDSKGIGYERRQQVEQQQEQQAGGR